MADYQELFKETVAICMELIDELNDMRNELKTQREIIRTQGEIITMLTDEEEY